MKKTRNRYTINYFINKFKKIPANQWTTGLFKDLNGKKCALGHCGYTKVGKPTKMSSALHNLAPNIIIVNDNSFNRFLTYGKTPKTRVINYLKELAQEKNG